MSSLANGFGMLIIAFTLASGQFANAEAWVDFDPRTGAVSAQVEDVVVETELPPVPLPVPFLPGVDFKPLNPAPYLARTATGMPYAGTNIAPANLALRAQGKYALPPTCLDSFVMSSGMRDDIYGMDGQTDNKVYSCIESGIYGGAAIGLTTGQRAAVPAVSTFPTQPNAGGPGLVSLQ